MMFFWGDSLGGDLVVNSENPDESFNPGVRFYFRYADILQHPGHVFDGYHAIKVKDKIVLSNYLCACIVPEQFKGDLEKLILPQLLDRVHYLPQNGLGIYEWSERVMKTFCRIASYLKKDGVFIFSWSHPIHKCVSAENDMFVFKKSYFDESRYSMVFNDGTLTLSDYRMSTYVNALYKAGFIIEQMIEEPDDDLISDTNSDHARKAKMIPATFVIKARKL